MPFDANATRAYGSVYAAVAAAGRKARRARAVDLLIAATTPSMILPLSTRNGANFRALDNLIEVADV